MKLTEVQVQLIRSSWKVFRKMNPVLIGEVFYSKLFLDYPKLRRSYPTDITEQYPQLLSMLSNIVRRLDQPETLKQLLSEIAENRKWPAAGHYQKIGAALQWTLKQGLGNDWNNELECAWKNGIEMVTAKMCYKEKTDDKNKPHPRIMADEPESRNGAGS